MYISDTIMSSFNSLGVYMQFEYDDEDPRVSRSQPQGSDNYHSIPASTPTKIFDNNDPLKFQNDQGPLMFQPTSKPNLIQQQSKSYPNNLRVQKHQKKIQASEGERDELNSSRQSCQWMTLDEFKNVSLDTVEVIIKDKQENACYILTIRAYLKKDEFTYFPVNKYKTYHYDKNFYTIPSDGANNRFPTNCSLTSISGDGATGPLRTVIPFQEEITISVECGYLILKFVSQGYYLKLETLSFYQNSGNSETHSPNQRSNYQDRGFYRSKPKMSNEHLVFSPKNTSQNPPLLITPLVSRFVCQNRVVLNGFNEVQFVTDKFELLRLLYTPSLMPLPSLDNYKNRKVNNEFWYPHRRSEIRNTRDTRLTSSGPVVGK